MRTIFLVWKLNLLELYNDIMLLVIFKIMFLNFLHVLIGICNLKYNAFKF